MSAVTAAPARAHGGEDHGEAAPEPAHVHGDTRRVESATSAFEAVVRWEMKDAPQPTALTVLLADFATSAPLPTDAKVDLLFSGPGTAQATALSTGEPGAFAASLTFPADGTYTLTMTVTLPGRGDVLLVPGITVGPPEPVAGPEHEDAPGVPLLWLVLAPLLALGFAGLGFLAGRRRAGAALGLLALFAPSLHDLSARAHGGEDHGAPAPATPASGSGAVSLPLEAQFLLGLATARAEHRELTERLRVTGTVTAPPGAYATLSWPHPARLELAPDRPFPHLGQYVEKGQVLALLVELADPGDRASLEGERIRARGEIGASEARVRALRQDRDRKRQLGALISKQELADAEAALSVALAELQAARATVAALDDESPILRLPLVAPTSGLIAALGAAPGTFVAAGAPILSILDPSTQWVEGRVFETDVARVDPLASALVTVETRPGEALVARPIGAAPEIDEATRTRRLVYQIETGAAPLLLGQYVSLEIPMGQPVHGVVVPAIALVDIDGRPVVWVKTAAERFEPRGVAVLASEGASVAVRGAVAEGERVVVMGAAFLRGAAPALDEGRP